MVVALVPHDPESLAAASGKRAEPNDGRALKRLNAAAGCAIRRFASLVLRRPGERLSSADVDTAETDLELAPGWTDRLRDRLRRVTQHTRRCRTRTREVQAQWDALRGNNPSGSEGLPDDLLQGQALGRVVFRARWKCSDGTTRLGSVITRPPPLYEIIIGGIVGGGSLVESRPSVRKDGRCFNHGPTLEVCGTDPGQHRTESCAGMSSRFPGGTPRAIREMCVGPPTAQRTSPELRALAVAALAALGGWSPQREDG